jgi:hypothetical protein
MNKEYNFNDNSDLDDKKDLFNAIATLTKLYTDKTHLIYELLQNAEDCHAKRVKFIMYIDRLEMWHDGEPFNAVNLKSIRSVNQSTKSDKLNAIGKFGVGFKAVFCICETVEVYNEPENFAGIGSEHLPRFAVRIDDFRIMKETAFSKKFSDSFTTCFVFPFATTSEGKDFLGYRNIDELRNALSSKLLTLGSDAMLFLKNIGEIKIEIISDEEEREERLLKKSYVKGYDNVFSIDETGATYLKYSANAPNVRGKTVDLVFEIKWHENIPEFIKPNEKHRHIFVYFPTETESKLNFIVQAPFMTTPNRESVPSTEMENVNLARIAAALLEKAVLDIKARGWLTLDFLSLLPIGESYPSDWLFKPMQEKTNEMFKSLDILPTIDDGFTTAKNANIAYTSELAEVFNGNTLGKLLNNSAAVWLPTTLTRYGELKNLRDYLINPNGVNISVRRPEQISDLLSRKSINLANRKPNFFDKTLSDKWLVDFYNYIADRERPVKEKFKDVKFVKTECGRFVKPDSTQLFIRPKNNIDYSEDFLFVADFIVENCNSLLESFRIMLPNEYDILEKEMNEYHDMDIDEDKSLRHLKTALRFLYKDGVADFFIEKLWLKCIDPNGDGIWVTPNDTIYFIDDKYGVSLRDYFDGIDSSMYFLDETYYEDKSVSESELKKLSVIGVRNSIYAYDEETYWYEGNAKCSNVGDFKRRLTILNIKDALDFIDKSAGDSAKMKSEIIFRLLYNVQKHLKGRWRQTANAIPIDDVAEIVRILCKREWLFSNDDYIYMPNEISRYDLDTNVYGDIDETSEIYDILGFNKTEADDFEEISLKIENLTQSQKEALLSKLAVSSQESDDFNFDDVDNIQTFPESGKLDLDRLKNKVNDDYKKAPIVKYDYVQRHIRISQNITADKEYISGIYGGFCQMCEQHIGYGRMCALFLEPKKELKQLNLSFCPNCAAKYIKLRYDTDLMENFADELVEADINGSLKIPLDENEIRFTKAHLAEIQELLRLQSEEEN